MTSRTLRWRGVSPEASGGPSGISRTLPCAPDAVGSARELRRSAMVPPRSPAPAGSPVVRAMSFVSCRACAVRVRTCSRPAPSARSAPVVRVASTLSLVGGSLQTLVRACLFFVVPLRYNSHIEHAFDMRRFPVSTILIDRRTAALLGELAAEPASTPARGGRRTASRRPQATPARAVALEVRSEPGESAPTRPAVAARATNSRVGAEVTVRRPATGGAAVRRSHRCRPAVREAGGTVAVTPRRRAARTPAVPKPSLHLTRRGRLVALLLLLVLVTLAFSVGRVTTTALGAEDGPGQQVVVQQGDTLWSIAERIAPDSDPRAVANDLMAVNGLGSPSLEVGQHLRLP